MNEPTDDLLERRKVQTFIQSLADLLDGRTTRENVVSYCEAIGAPYGKRTFAKNSMAEFILQSAGHLTQEHEGTFIVRPEDVATYLKWLREGDSGSLQQEPLLHTTAPLVNLASQLHCKTTRQWVDGLGWQETLWFASALTGLVFHGRCAFASPVADMPPGFTVTLKKDDTDRLGALQDLLDTTLIPEESLTWIAPDVDASMLPIWTLRRQDDNGTDVEVGRYRSRVQAEAALIEFETRGHKQTYWLAQA